jgi:tRNA (guanine37-N1)-methyltransferase
MMPTPEKPSLDQQPAPCIRVPRSKGEQFKRSLDAVSLRDLSLKIRPDNDSIVIPLNPEANLQTIRNALKEPQLRIIKRNFENYSREKQMSLTKLLKDLGYPKAELVPRAYDIIGDIAIIELPRELAQDSNRIGEALLTLHKRLKSVYARSGPVTGEYRLRKLKLIAGEPKTKTTHRENGCLFKVNVATTFFNPRLGGERRRVASQISKNERVLDMFAGVGPFSILITKLVGAEVYAIDINPEAVNCLRENIQLNNVEDRVEVLESDAARLPPRLKGKMSRVIMNLPEKSLEFVESACRALKDEGGILHFYSFQSEPKPVVKAEAQLTEAVDNSGRVVKEIMFARSIREIAARTYQVVIDARIR